MDDAMMLLIVFFMQLIFCVFKTLIVYSAVAGNKHRTAGISVILGALHLAVLFLGLKSIESGNVLVVLAYLSGNYIGTYFSTNSKKEDSTLN